MRARILLPALTATLMYLEQQNQQLQTKVAEQQTQIQAQAQAPVQTGPVMTQVSAPR